MGKKFKIIEFLTSRGACSVRGRPQSGGVLPLLVIALVPLLFFAALAIDGAMLLSARSDLETKTRRVALSAAGQYVGEYKSFQQTPNRVCAQCPGGNSGPGCASICASWAARERASSVAKRNLSVGEKLSADANDPINVLQLQQTAGTGQSPANPEGEIEVGTYYWIMPDECEFQILDCPQSVPGFVPQAITSANVNAVRVKLKMLQDNSLLARFSKIMGYGGFTMETQAIAALLPRNDAFVIDLSRSIYRDNYLRSDYRDGFGTITPRTAADFAIKTKAGYSCPETFGARTASAVCCPGGNGCTTDPNCSSSADQNDRNASFIETADGYGIDHSRFHDLYGSINDAGGALDSVPESYRHYSRNYGCVSVDVDNSGGPESYLIDFGSDTLGQFNARPEPLFSVLEAAHEGLRLLIERAISVDRVVIHGFDSRTENPANPSIRFLPASVPVDSGVVGEFLDALDLQNRGISTGFASKGLFPVPGSYSDIFYALRLAGSQISDQPSYKVAKNSIVLFSDGLQNCPYVWSPIPNDPWNSWSPAGVCDDNGASVIDGIALLGDSRFVDELIRRQISVSMVMLGSSVMPHYLVRQNDAGNGCRNQIEDVALGAPSGGFVDSAWSTYQSMRNDPDQIDDLDDAFFGASEATPFVAPNHLYETLVAPTNGLWVPLLPPLMIGSNTAPFYTQLEAACAAMQDGDNSVLANLELQVPDPAAPQTTYAVTVTDAAGRIRYDPYGRSPSQQLRDAMGLIVQSPYALVP